MASGSTYSSAGPAVAADRSGCQGTSGAAGVRANLGQPRRCLNPPRRLSASPGDAGDHRLDVGYVPGCCGNGICDKLNRARKQCLFRLNLINQTP